MKSVERKMQPAGKGEATPVPGGNPESYYAKAPSWRFSKADFDGEWSPRAILREEAVFNRLVSFERQTWGGIVTDKKNNHFIAPNQMIKAARKRIEELRYMEYADSLFSVRVGGRERLWGILADGIFYVVWYDQNHEICPSNLKHT